MYKIRNASRKDIESIMEIEKASFIKEIQEKKELFLKRLELFNDGFLIFIDDNNLKPFGYFSTELWTSIPQDSNTFAVGHDIEKLHSNNGNILYISSFAILPEYRGKGNGTELFNKSIEFIKTSRNINKIVLLVNELWKIAFSIYKENGFSVESIVKNAFQASDGTFSNGIVMTKTESKQKQ